jgi:ureidoglycolate hydrolase
MCCKWLMIKSTLRLTAAIPSVIMTWQLSMWQSKMAVPSSATPLAMPIKIEMMERHPLGSQAFMPLSQHPYLVVVAPKGKFEQDKIEVFLAQPTQGVNYHKGTWHHFCLALNQDCDFLVIDRSGNGNNCDVETLDGSKLIEAFTLEP